MPLQNCSEQVFCPLRRSWVAALPEEIVRQKLLAQMIQQLGYPIHTLAVEKKLQQIPHLAHRSDLPARRADILCLIKNNNSYHPLLVIECKAVPITAKVIKQVVAYNYYLQSRYICVANQDEVRTGWFDTTQNTYQFVPHLPHFETLLTTEITEEEKKNL